MSETTIEVWLCPACIEYNLIQAEACGHCHAKKPDVARLERIGLKTPAALELLGDTGKARKSGAKGGNKGKNSSAGAAVKESKKKKLENDFFGAWLKTGLGVLMVRQYPVKSKRYITPKRRDPVTYNLDFAIPTLRLCIEIQGGTHTNGAHSRGVGYNKDRRRVRELQYMGWVVFEFTTDDLQANTLWQTIEEVREMVQLLQKEQAA